jgi:probable 2-oxoglutarate dehydrogenase E1 component DHKTD1
MGAWSFVAPRFRNLVGVNLKYAGRAELCQPAVGVSAVHKHEVERLFQDTFA